MHLLGWSAWLLGISKRIPKKCTDFTTTTHFETLLEKKKEKKSPPEIPKYTSVKRTVGGLPLSHSLSPQMCH